MGNSQTNLRVNYLQAQNRLLIKNNLSDAVDPLIRRKINHVKDGKEYQNLVLSGGAIKGIAHVGALLKLAEFGVLDNIKQIACSSVASIIGSLLAVGYNAHEIREIVMKMDTAKISDVKKGLVTDIFRIVTVHGISSGGHVVDFIGHLIEKRTGDSNYTFKDLWNDRKILLAITGTDLNKEDTVVFWHGSNPDLPIKYAVRMSIGLPYIFQPVIFGNHFVVDGGMLDNCPEDMFDGEFPGDPMARLNLVRPNPYTLALDITGSIVSEHKTTYRDINSTEGYGVRLIDTLFTGSQRLVRRPCYWMRTITIHTPDYPLSHFAINDVEKQTLISLGYDSCEKFFEK
jgi:NTE family protein